MQSPTNNASLLHRQQSIQQQLNRILIFAWTPIVLRNRYSCRRSITPLQRIEYSTKCYMYLVSCSQLYSNGKHQIAYQQCYCQIEMNKVANFSEQLFSVMILHIHTLFNSLHLYIYVCVYLWLMKNMIVNTRQTTEKERPIYETIDSGLLLI